MRLTWYGALSGPSSAPVVARGFISALEEAGVEVERVDLRQPPAEIARRVQRLKQGRKVQVPSVPGAAVVQGFPEWSLVVPRHKTLWAYCWAEADLLPPTWAPTLNRLDGVFTDSRHSAAILESHGVTVPLVSCPHGLGPELGPNGLGEPSNGTFRFLHFCAGDAAVGRKGTRELLEAWDRVSGQLGDGRLVVVTSSKVVRRAVGALQRSWTVDLLPEAWRLPEEQARLYQAHHVVVAPSRAEGFGRVPVEALACGVPVAATTCTGHAEWAPYVQGGLVEIPTRGVAICPPGTGKAPRLEVDAVEAALLSSHYQYGRLRTEALEAASALRQVLRWSAEPLLTRLAHGNPGP